MVGDVPMCMFAFWQSHKQKPQAPWMNQSNLAAALEGGALAWIGATDYYRLPHVLYFDSVASIGSLMQRRVLQEASVKIKIESRRIRAHSLAFYRDGLLQLMGEKPMEGTTVQEALPVERRHFRHWKQLPEGGTCWNGFITQADFPQAACDCDRCLDTYS